MLIQFSECIVSICFHRKGEWEEMGINAGRLRKKICIMRYKNEENQLGGTVVKLEPFKTVYAEIRPLRGKEYLEYYKDNNSLEYKITVRYIPDLSPSDVLKYRGRQFLINSIIDVEEQGYIQEIMCTEQIKKQKPEVRENGS